MRTMLSSRCKRAAFLSALLLGFATAAWADTPAISLFELDGNSVDDSPEGAPDDWNTLNGTTGQNGSCTGECKLNVFATDGDGQTIFTGGGSKDNADISSWAYKSGSVPPKDEIQNAYAASYNAPNGDVIIYFGADREAVRRAGVSYVVVGPQRVRLEANDARRGARVQEERRGDAADDAFVI